MPVNIDPNTFTLPTDYYLELDREVFTEKSIIGTLYLCVPRRSDHEIIQRWDTLELPYNDNKRSESCIRTGVYKMGRRTHGGYAERYNKRFGHPNVWEVEEVDERSDILIHVGNYPRNTKGCILVGHNTDRPDHIGDSVKAYKDFFTTLDELMLEKIKGHTLYIKINSLY